MYGKRSIAAALLMLFAVEALAADVLLANEASSRAAEESAIKPAAITNWDQKPMGRTGVGTALTVTGLVMGGIGVGYKFGDPRPETPYTTVTLDVHTPASQVAFGSFGRSEKSGAIRSRVATTVRPVKTDAIWVRAPAVSLSELADRLVDTGIP